MKFLETLVLVMLFLRTAFSFCETFVQYVVFVYYFHDEIHCITGVFVKNNGSMWTLMKQVALRWVVLVDVCISSSRNSR